MNKKRQLYIFLAQSILVVIMGVICYCTITSYHQNKQENLTIDIVKNSVNFAEILISEKGVIEQRNGLIYAGDFLINNSDEIVKKVKTLTGYGCTIFQGNKRISTTAVALNESKSAIGTFANEEVTQLVYVEGKTFEGVTEAIGKNWLIIYKPLLDVKGQKVGMIAVFKEYDDFLKSIWYFKIL